MLQSEGQHAVFLSSLQITWRKACSDTEIHLPTNGIDPGTSSCRDQCTHTELQCFIVSNLYCIYPPYSGRQAKQYRTRLDAEECDIRTELQFANHPAPFLDISKLNSWPRWFSRMLRLNGDQEGAGLILFGSSTFFRDDLSWIIFYSHSLPSADSRRAVVSFWQKSVHSTG